MSLSFKIFCYFCSFSFTQWFLQPCLLVFCNLLFVCNFPCPLLYPIRDFLSSSQDSASLFFLFLYFLPFIHWFTRSFYILPVYSSFLSIIFLRLFQNLSASLDSSYKKGSTSTLTCDVTGRKLSGHILLRIIRFSLLHTQVHDINFRCACAPLQNAHTDTKYYFLFRYSKVNARIYEQLFTNQTTYYHSCIFFE